MKLATRIITLIVGILPLAVWAQPSSPEEFISAFRKAVQEKSPEKFGALCYTVGMSVSDKDATNFWLKVFENKNIKKISIEPLDNRELAVTVSRGKKCEYTYPPKGLVQAKYSNGETVGIPYAIIDKHYFLIFFKTTDLKWNGAPDTAIILRVTGKGENRVQIKAAWNASGFDMEESLHAGIQSISGQYVKAVTVTSTEDETDVTLTITQDGENIFASQPLKGKGTIVYKKKS